MSRYGLNVLLQRDVEFPWGTLTANLAGCLVMGIVALLFAVGFCGSFTTLSAFVMELNTMVQKNEFFFSFSYIVATLVGGFACFYVGIMLMRLLLPESR